MTAKALQLLLVEDNPAHAELIRRAFLSYDRQVELTVARTLQEARATPGNCPTRFGNHRFAPARRSGP